MPAADWFFDYVSPYPYLQLARFHELPADLVVRPRPLLFAGLLNHWGHLGPAEIPAKKLQTFRLTRHIAERRGLPFAGPPRHPFNPLALLRLTLVAGPTVETVRAIYDHVWGEGRDGQDPESVAEVAAALGVDDLSALDDPAVKATLRENGEAAVAAGVYGVPTFLCDGELFWGDDATDLFIAFLKNPEIFRCPPYAAAETVEPAA
ncbi:MAG: 2-hydroxychromene-2-carboxylate isomerase, partial [Pseudomonadota bacterium]